MTTTDVQNQQSFSVEFTRDQIEQLLANNNTDFIIVYGTYSYRPDLGENVWEMKAYGEGLDDDKSALGGRVTACIRPCT